jgi:hypothetical protein
MTSLLDANVARVRAHDDDLAQLRVRPPTEPQLAKRVVMRLAPNEAKMIRLFRKNGSGEPELVLGGGVTELPMPSTCKPNVDFLVDAVTLPGDPTIGWKAGVPAPAKPMYHADRPASSRPNGPIYPERAPGEVWIELVHEGVSGDRPKSDAALLTVAPFLLIPNTEPVERLFVVYIPRRTHAFVYDILEACQSIWPGAVALPTDTTAAIQPPTPRSPVQIIDGDALQDAWIQDAMEIGYCHAPHRSMHVAFQCIRSAPLAEFVRRNMPAPGIGLFEAIAGNPADEEDGVSFGGNIEVSP